MSNLARVQVIDKMCCELRSNVRATNRNKQTHNTRAGGCGWLDASPLFSEVPQVELEGPGLSDLAHQREHAVSNRFWAQEELGGFVAHQLARARQIHHPVEDHVRDMNALGPKLARHRLRDAALGRLGGGKRKKLRTTAQRCRRADHNDAAAASLA